MARRFLPMASRTGRRTLTGVLLLIIATGTQATEPAGGDVASANNTAHPTLKPYHTEYRTTARGMSLTLERELKTDGEGHYTLTNGGKLLVVGFHEVSVFTINDARIQPKSYVYQGTGLINRRREVHFVPGSDTIRSLYKDEWYELPYTEGTLDRMSQQEQLRLTLLTADEPRQDLAIRIADGSRVKDYELVFVGDELIETPLGLVNTLHFERLHDDPERASHLWLAPDWDYLMVKTLHVEDDKPIEITLTSGTIAGIPIGDTATSDS